MRFSALSTALLALVLPGPLAAGPQSREALPPQPEVRLEAHEGKTHFYLGQRIQLDLVFRNQTGEPYPINVAHYQELVDDVEITPATGWFKWRTSSGHDYVGYSELGPKERFTIVLNQDFVFRDPGHYKIRLTTRRLLQSAPITTNAVAIDLEAMPVGTEAELLGNVRRAIGSLDSRVRSANRERGEALTQLADLEGDDALRAKMDLILAGDEQMRFYSPEAMAATRNLQLQLSLLEAAWRNPQQMPLYDLPSLLAETRALLRGQSQPGWWMGFSAPNSDNPDPKRIAEERTADMKALLDTLPQRSGANRAAALYYLLIFPGLSDADVDRVRPIVAAEFQTLNAIEQDVLLAGAWSRLRDPAMIAPLKTLLEKTPQNKGAAQRLIELDPQGAKPYVIQAVCGRGWPVPLESVASLPVDTLPEVDGCLGELLSTPPAQPHDNPWSMHAALAARFATAAILPQVHSGWKYPEQDGAVLPLLLRWSPEEAMSRIKADPFDSNRLLNLFFSIDKSFTSRQADFPPQLAAWLRQMLQDGPDDQASFAAFQLSEGGAKQDRALLESRLGRLRKEWSGKNAEIEAANKPEGSTAARDSRRLEIELISALGSRRFWSLSDEELAALTQGCMSAQCRNYHRPRKPQATE